MRLVKRLDEPPAYGLEQIVPCGKVEIERAFCRAGLAHDVLDPDIGTVLSKQPLGCIHDFLPPDVRIQAAARASGHAITY